VPASSTPEELELACLACLVEAVQPRHRQDQEEALPPVAAAAPQYHPLEQGMVDSDQEQALPPCFISTSACGDPDVRVSHVDAKPDSTDPYPQSLRLLHHVYDHDLEP
jgi:hypothetical protein